MSCSQAAASSSSASVPRAGARLRARAATPWTWAQRRGRACSSRVRARRSAQVELVSISARLVILAGTFTHAACRLETSETSLLPRSSHLRQEVEAGPDDPAAFGGGLDTPAVRAGECFDYVQAMGTVIGLAVAPGAAEVFGFDPYVIRKLLDSDGEELASAG
jgi:hypothetical protein